MKSAEEDRITPKIASIMKMSDAASLRSTAEGTGPEEERKAAWRRLSQILPDANAKIQAVVEYTESIKKAVAQFSLMGPSFFNSPAGKNMVSTTTISEALRGCLDVEVLADIAAAPIKENFKEIAAQGIKDSAVLKKLVERDASAEGKAVFLRHIEDDQFLRKVFEDKNQSEAVRIAAAKNLKDQGALTRAVKDRKLPSGLRRAAIAGCSDEKALQTLAGKGEEMDIRAAALRRISDQKFLSRVVEQDEAPSLVLAAIGQITDQAMIARIAKGYAGKADAAAAGSVRRAAIERLEDQATLKEIALSKADWIERDVATGRLVDQDAIRDVYLNTDSAWVKNSALKRLKDQDTLRQVLLGPVDKDAMRAAVENLERKDYLVEVAKALHGNGSLEVTELAPGGVFGKVLSKIHDDTVVESFVDLVINKYGGDFHHPLIKLEMTSVIDALSSDEALARLEARLKSTLLDGLVQARRLKRG